MVKALGFCFMVLTASIATLYEINAMVIRNEWQLTVTSKIPKLSLTIGSSGHLYKQKTIPRIFLHALISLVHQNTSSGILADKRPEKLVPPAFPALQSPIISSLSVCLPSSARFTLCPPPWWPGHRKCQRGFESFVPASATTAKKHAMSWVLVWVLFLGIFF